MNSKGFYTLLIGIIIASLAASIIVVQLNVSKAKASATEQRAIFDLKYGMQNTRFLLDKALVDAIVDCPETPPTCEVKLSCVPDKFNDYAQAVLDKAESDLGISCDSITIPSFVNSAQVSFVLKCKKTLNGFKVQTERQIALQKEYEAVNSNGCVINVRDLQTGTSTTAMLDYPGDGVTVILDNMDATTGWVVEGAMTSITLNATTKKEGSGALNLIKQGTTTNDASVRKNLSTPVDLTNKIISVWVYFKDQATVDKVSSAQLYLFSGTVDPRPHKGWMVAESVASQVGWNLFSIDTSTAAGDDSGADLSAITAIRLDVDTVNAIDKYAEGDVIADEYSYTIK